MFFAPPARPLGAGPRPGPPLPAPRAWLLRPSPVPVGPVPLYQALAPVPGAPPALPWALSRDTVLAQCAPGVASLTVHAGVL
ncbi:phosphomethylpyrimidine synthase ThiC, partial [Mycobacterium tuberculosis]|uniref:phosphomethylpyrimidine synthase ThiC n=1 Tax=Mycobacterium tuberculosis TaxID=1773 RepID=UPI003C6DBD61